MFLLYQQRTDNEQERQRIALDHGIWALTKLQSGWRRILSTRIAARLSQQVRRELTIQNAMKTQRSNFLRERKIYKRQLTDWYESMKADHDRRALEENRKKQGQIMIRTLQRCIKNEEIRNAPPDMSEELADAMWESEQLSSIQSRVERYKYHLQECLDKPDNRAERKTRSVVRKRIKERLRVVLRRADESNVIMETPEVGSLKRRYDIEKAENLTLVQAGQRHCPSRNFAYHGRGAPRGAYARNELCAY